MPAVVARNGSEGWRLEGAWVDREVANRFLAHLVTRAFSPATVRAYAYDLVNFGRFCVERGVGITDAVPTDFFDYLDWQQRPRPSGPRGAAVVALAARGPAPATMNRRIAAVRALFEFAVNMGVRPHSPVPSARRSSGLRAPRRGLLGHLPPRRQRGGGRLVRQARRLPESLEPDDVAVFLADLSTHRDRAMVLAMVLGGLRAAEVRGLRLADVDLGLRRLRVLGKGGRQRLVPVDRVFFAEVTSYLRVERPPGCQAPECFVVLHGPTAGRPLTEAGLRSVFRRHRVTSGAIRVRPHRLRHTFGTELAAAGIDLLVLRELMGHARPETTASYVHLSFAAVSAEYAQARTRIHAPTQAPTSGRKAIQ